MSEQATQKMFLWSCCWWLSVPSTSLMTEDGSSSAQAFAQASCCLHINTFDLQSHLDPQLPLKHSLLQELWNDYQITTCLEIIRIEVLTHTHQTLIFQTPNFPLNPSSNMESILIAVSAHFSAALYSVFSEWKKIVLVLLSWPTLCQDMTQLLVNNCLKTSTLGNRKAKNKMKRRLGVGRSSFINPPPANIHLW